ncbi:MAG TPA: sensor histidine kinase [Bacteroidia bacterium]|jgi:signal transduction histidine kinase|nr:sensor histidine kinase [Bacteroidia bacterium]
MIIKIKKNSFTYSLLCLLITITNTLYAQQIDSLLNLIKTDKKDTNKINHLTGLSEEFRLAGEYDKGLIYAKEGLNLAKTLDYKVGIETSCRMIGKFYVFLGNYSESRKYYLVTLKINQETKNKKGMANSYLNLGAVYFHEGNYPEAVKNNFTALKLFEEIKDKKGIANTYNNLGNIYKKQSNFPEALKCHLASLKLKEEIKDNYGIGTSYINIGTIYNQKNDHSSALQNFFAALKIFEDIKDKEGIATAYNNIGSIYMYEGNYAESLKNYLAALKIREKIEDKEGVASCFIDLGAIYTRLKKTKEAEAYLKRALDISKEIHSIDLIKESYAYMSDLDSVTGNYQAAFKHYKLFICYLDSLADEESQIKSLQIINQYETEKKEKEIAILNADLLAKQKDQEILNTKVEEKNSIILATSLGTLLLIISGILFFSRRQLKQKSQHQEEISKQQENTAVAIIQAQENERNRIAQDLHDGMGTFLSTLKINLQSFEDSIPKEKITNYKNISALVDKTSAELRSIMKDISSETLQENGLEGALRELTENVNRSGAVHLNFLSHGLTKRLDSIIEINLYRVTQELINNCIKHADATQATLQLIDHGDTVLLMMEDNGKGFDGQNLKQEKNSGKGLKNIHNRVNFIKGTLKSESVINKGSTFVIETPKSLY